MKLEARNRVEIGSSEGMRGIESKKRGNRANNEEIVKRKEKSGEEMQKKKGNVKK